MAASVVQNRTSLGPKRNVEAEGVNERRLEQVAVLNLEFED
jgi:hypothetical protein